MEIDDNWLPTSANINALPAPLRQYIHDLEINCDPSFIISQNIFLRDQCQGLQIMYRKAADQLENIMATTPEGISAFRLISLKRQLKFEMLGMKSSGGAIRPRIAKEFGLPARASHAAFIAAVEAKLEEVKAEMYKASEGDPL